MPVTPSVSLPERFEILTHVANGGMASVWAAEDRVLGRRVAVKLLAEQFVGDAHAKVRFNGYGYVGARWVRVPASRRNSHAS